MLTLVGIDPGIVDTAMVKIALDHDECRWHIEYKVWTNVTNRNKFSIIIDPYFLDELKSYIDKDDYVYIEGFRQRGRDTRQDQNMLALVQGVHKTLRGSTIIDNTGIKKIVTEDLLKLFRVGRFPGTNHADLKSAARVALAGGIKDVDLNESLSDFVKDQLGGVTWEFGSMLTP